MIDAVVMVYGDGNQINRGTWAFEHLPRRGDEVTLFDRRGLYSVRVRDVEHKPSPAGRNIKDLPMTFIIGDFAECDELQHFGD